MNQNYVETYRSFRDEFMTYKESPFIKHTTLPMNQGSLNLTLLRSNSPGAGSYAAASCLSSSSQRDTPISTLSSHSPSGIASRDILTEEEATDERDDGLKEVDGEDTEGDQSSALIITVPSQRPRKGHKKSRQGCYNCKRRKIKCQETQPECENCTRRTWKCRYPAPKTLAELQLSTSYAPSPITSVTLQPHTSQFTSTDMRLFHHFLMTAYPHLPVGKNSAWLCQVPLIAHHNEYLMHAILGLAASHLESATEADLRSVAIDHRALAIRGSNAAISKTHRSGSDADALLASCYALTFQSIYMSDGLQDFFRMVRGCSLLSDQFKSENIPMAFFLTDKDHFQYMEDKLLDLPFIDNELVEGAERSLIKLTPLFNLPSHTYFYQLLRGVIEALRLSSLGAYFKFIMVYQGIQKMDNQMFQEFMCPTNAVARLLIAHFLAIQMVVAPIIEREYAGRTMVMPTRGENTWISTLIRECPIKFRRYMEWPVAVTACLRGELSRNEKRIPDVSILKKKERLSQAIF